jgi:hypothetical protein
MLGHLIEFEVGTLSLIIVLHSTVPLLSGVVVSWMALW